MNQRIEFILSRPLVFVFVLLILIIHPGLAQQPSRSFELRYVTNDTAANGETDFKGKTEYLDTEQRVDFLKQYARVASRFFNDTAYNTKVVTEQEVQSALAKIKPQPLPSVRRRIPLEEWQYLGYRAGQHTEDTLQLQRWQQEAGVRLDSGHLTIAAPEKTLSFSFPSQSWRFSLRWRVQAPSADQRASFTLTDQGGNPATTVGFGANGRFFYRTANGEEQTGSAYQPNRWYELKLEVDLAAFKRKEDAARYNFYVDDSLVADYVTVERMVTGGVGYAESFISLAGVNQLTVRAPQDTQLDDLWGVGYHPTGRETYPYTIETFLDEDFEAKPTIDGWETDAYSDAAWPTDTLPIAHGSERHHQEDLYLRKKVFVPAYQHARLVVEMLDPGGEVWINGKVVTAVHNRHPIDLDVTEHLVPGDTNLLAVKVNHFYLTEREGEVMPHSSLDFNVGWFAGRMHLDLVGKTTVEDVFVHTESLSDDQRQATLKARVQINHQGYLSFRGQTTINAYPWYPEEADEPVATTSFPVVIGHGPQTFEHTWTVNNPRLWTAENPQLYKLEVVLEEEGNNQPVDDAVVTTGIRTLSQEGGSFHVNGQLAMLNGAQIMGFRGPLEDMMTQVRCPPAEWLAKEILMVQKMHGNLIRVHVHAWEFPAENINDPRLPEIADQLGMMLIWGTPAWIRTGYGWGQIDFAGFPEYMKQVYNHPSIAVWEAANHTQSFKGRDVMESNLFCEKVYNTIYPVDPSRLISLNSYVRHLHYGNDAGTIDQQGNPIEPSPAWTAPMVTRGNQDGATGYSANWSQLRNWPGAYRQSFLDSKQRAYFNFEHEESMAQPNWNLSQGKPWHRLHSYEWEYDEGTIGRRLELDEWRESQAWQGFSAWESMKKQRYIDYDGFSWCCLHGGANSVTYKKPLIDFTDHAKLAFWTNKMIFQPTVAGSHNVDVVYGLEDSITPVIMHLGEDEVVDLEVVVSNMEGKETGRKRYKDVQLKTGRNATELPAWRPDFNQEGYYVIDYVIQKR